ncbi:hypothetical protein [Pseudomonas cavernicola]|nr:hypothetical protein [Pseudomonas cavernicola]
MKLRRHDCHAATMAGGRCWTIEEAREIVDKRQHLARRWLG